MNGLSAGAEFNPWRGACGFYSPDIVGRQPHLTDSQKRLYERLVRFAGRNGYCFPQFATLAAELGKSVSQIKRNIVALEQAGFIRHAHRAGRRSNTYMFLWHPCFDGASTGPKMLIGIRAHNVDSSSTHHQQDPQHSPNEMSREFAGARLRVPRRSTNSVQEIQSRNSGLKKKEAAPPWKPSGAEASAALEELHRAGKAARLGIAPDLGLVTEIGPHFLGLEDLRLWLSSSAGHLRTAKTWGLFVTDARRWHTRRAEAQIRQQELQAAESRAHDIAVAECQELDRIQAREGAA